MAITEPHGQLVSAELVHEHLGVLLVLASDHLVSGTMHASTLFQERLRGQE